MSEEDLSFRVDLIDSYDRVLKKAKDGKTSTKTLISFWEGRANASEAYGKAMSKLKILDKLGEEGSFEIAWTENISSISLCEIAHIEFSSIIRMEVVSRMTELLDFLRKEKAKFEKIEHESQTRVLNAESSLSKAQGKVQKAIQARDKQETQSTLNAKNMAKFKAAEMEVITLQKLQTDAEEVLSNVNESHRKTMASVLESLNKLEVDRMNTITNILKVAAEADRKLASKTTIAVSTSVEAFQSIDIQKDINSFILKAKKGYNPERASVTIPVVVKSPVTPLDSNEGHVIMDLAAFLTPSPPVTSPLSPSNDIPPPLPTASHMNLNSPPPLPPASHMNLNSPPPLPTASHMSASSSPPLPLPSVNTSSPLRVTWTVNHFTLIDEDIMKLLCYEDLLVSYECNGPAKLNRNDESYFLFTHIRATLGVSMNDHQNSLNICGVTFRDDRIINGNHLINTRMKMMLNYSIVNEKLIPDIKWRRRQLAYIYSYLNQDEETFITLASDVLNSIDLTSYHKSIEALVNYISRSDFKSTKTDLKWKLCECIILSLFDSNEDDIKGFQLHSNSEALFSLFTPFLEYNKIPILGARVMQITKAYQLNIFDRCIPLFQSYLAPSLPTGGSPEAMEIYHLLESNIIKVLENNLYNYRSYYTDSESVHEDFTFYSLCKGVTFTLNPDLTCNTCKDWIDTIIKKGLYNEYNSLLPPSTLRPIGDLSLVSNLCDAMNVSLQDAITSSVNLFGKIVKEQKLTLHIPSLVINTIMNLVRDDIDQCLSIANINNVGGEGIMQLYRGLLTFEKTCFNVNGLSPDQRLCSISTLNKLEELLNAWLQQVVLKCDGLIARATDEDNFEGNHVIRNIPNSSLPSSSVIDVFSLISKTIENVISSLGGELLPSNGIISFTDSMIDLIIRYLRKLSVAAGVPRYIDIIPSIPPYPLESLGTIKFPSAKNFLGIKNKNTSEIVQHVIEIDYVAITRCLVMLNNLRFASVQIIIIKKRLIDMYMEASRGKGTSETISNRFSKVYTNITSCGNDIAKAIAIQIIFKDLESEILFNLYSNSDLSPNLTDFLVNFDQVIISISERVNSFWFPVVLKNIFDHLTMAWHRTLLNSGRYLSRGICDWEYSQDGGSSWVIYPNDIMNGLEDSFNEGRVAVQVKVGVCSHYVTFDNMTTNIDGIPAPIRRLFSQYGKDYDALFDFFTGPKGKLKQTIGLPYEYVKDGLKEAQMTIPLLHLSSAALISRLDSYPSHIRSRAKNILHHRDDKDAKKYCKSVR